MTSPYTDTDLQTTVMIWPHQMNNEIYLRTKRNLINNVVGKCTKYGYVSKIYEIKEYKTAEIMAENFTGAANVNIKYSASVCMPLENTQLICKIEQINTVLIATNGPIIVVVTMDRINEKKFALDNNGILKYIKKGTQDEIKLEQFVKITTVAKKFNLGDDKIRVIGFLEDIATDDEIKSYYEDYYKNKKEDKEEGKKGRKKIKSDKDEDDDKKDREEVAPLTDKLSKDREEPEEEDSIDELNVERQKTQEVIDVLGQFKKNDFSLIDKLDRSGKN